MLSVLSTTEKLFKHTHLKDRSNFEGSEELTIVLH